MPRRPLGLRAQPSLAQPCLLLPTAVSPEPALNHAFSLDREHKRLVAHVIEFDGIV